MWSWIIFGIFLMALGIIPTALPMFGYDPVPSSRDNRGLYATFRLVLGIIGAIVIASNFAIM